MNALFKKLKDFFKKDSSFKILIKILILTVIIYVSSLFYPSIIQIFKKFMGIAYPFIFGFVIAYVMRPLIVFLERKGIARKISIPISIILLVSFVWWVVISITPVVFEELESLMRNTSSSVDTLYNWYQKASDNPSDIFTSLVNQITSTINNEWLPNIGVYVTNLFSGVMSFFAQTILTFVIAIYLMFDYEKVTASFFGLAKNLHPEFPEYLSRIDSAVFSYTNSLIVLMLIKFVEYSILYRLIGHNSWLILGLLTSVGLIIPYIGPMLANTIGILTSLNLSFTHAIILIIAIGILSLVDEYVVTPLIYKKRIQISPIWSLFSIMFFGAFFGAIGIMVAIPVYLSIKEVTALYKENLNHEK